MRLRKGASRAVFGLGVEAGSLLFFILLGGCKPSDRADEDTSRPADFGFQKSVAVALVEDGQAAYKRYCIGCHGEQGDGRGPAAGFLDPKPRNFQKARFKFSSRGFGELATDDDLKRTIKNGLRGSAMPTFELLSNRTVESLIAYVKTFSPRWKEEQSGSAIPLVEDPYRIAPDKSAAIARGEAVYHGFAGCWQCHAAYVPADKLNEYLVAFGKEKTEFRKDLDQPQVKPNDEGELAYPPDFLRDFVRSGSNLDDLYHAIGGGISGTAMPKWIESIEFTPQGATEPLAKKSDIWALAYYVQDLIRRRPPKLKPDQFVVRNRPRTIYAHGLPETPVPTGETEGGENTSNEPEQATQESK